jgi:transcriptional regulator with PAS, ATPase and Fis domain
LLRVIEEKEVQPIGDDRVIPVEVRLIATTNKDLAREVKEKRFRGDLFYRLNVLQLNVPPLRERGRDAYVLFKHFILRVKPKCEKKYLFSKEVERLFVEHLWPGNVRELRNLVERLETLTDHFEENLQHVPEWIREELRRPDEREEIGVEEEEKSFTLREMERLWIKKLGESSSLRKSDLAKILGISRTTLWKKMKA